MPKPPTMAEAEARGLTTASKQGIYTFSNGTEWEVWAGHNCYECKFFDPDVGGRLCAFECAAFLALCSPELAKLFGWTQNAEYDKPDDHRNGWHYPDACPFFRDKADDGDDKPEPTPHDPAQFVLIADPTEDLAALATIELPELEFAAPTRREDTV